jgi:hypothetical protein
VGKSSGICIVSTDSWVDPKVAMESMGKGACTSILKTKFEMNKLYELDKEKLKFLIQFVKRKTIRRREEIVIMEKVFYLWKEKISKNWKSRRKKPSDKKIIIYFEVLSRKKFNQLKNVLRRSKDETRRNNANEVRMMQKILFNNVDEIVQNNRNINDGDIFSDARKETEGKLMKLQLYRSVVEIISHTSELVKIEVDIKCHGQVFEVLSIESHDRDQNSCILIKRKQSL